MSNLRLSPAEARVIAALAEKSIATPQYYPMTVNAIMLAANQKTSRSPVMSLTEGEVGAALTQLETQRLCSRDPFAGRVPKWRHQLQHQLLLKPPEFTVLLTLILRGPQTAAELRANAAVLGGPSEPVELQQVLTSLNDHTEPLVVALPRAPGQKESRYAHCLCGVPQDALFELPADTTPDVALEPRSGTRAAELEARIAKLESRITALEQALGMTPASE
jgi:uncharacterized protein YceH (UPF0502 family)